MAIVSEAGQVTRTGKSKLRAVPKSRESKASEPKPAKQGKEKKPKDPARCDLCGATDRPVRYHEGNASCEPCALAVQSDANQAADDQKTRASEQPRDAKPATIVTRSLADLARSYEAQMQKDSKTPATIAGYVNDLGIALRELGATTLVADLTAKQVAAYFACDAVTQLRSGGKKSQLSVDKTCRVLRLALEHAVHKGWIVKAPLPE